jgi:hypothetical protein
MIDCVGRIVADGLAVVVVRAKGPTGDQGVEPVGSARPTLMRHADRCQHERDMSWLGPDLLGWELVLAGGPGGEEFQCVLGRGAGGCGVDVEL